MNSAISKNLRKLTKFYNESFEWKLLLWFQLETLNFTLGCIRNLDVIRTCFKSTPKIINSKLKVQNLAFKWSRIMKNLELKFIVILVGQIDKNVSWHFPSKVFGCNPKCPIQLFSIFQFQYVVILSAKWWSQIKYLVCLNSLKIAIPFLKFCFLLIRLCF